MADTTIDFAALDQTTETPVETTEVQTPEVDSTQPEQQESQPQEQTQQTGRINHRQIAKTLAETAPEHAQALKQMADSYYYHQEYQKVFPKVQDAVSAKSLIDTLGGTEGIQTLQTRMGEYDAQDEGLRSGDPQVLDSLFKDFPEGAVQLAAPYMERLAKLAPEEFSSIVGPYAIDMIVNAGVVDSLQDAYNAQDPKQGIAKLWNWLQGQVQNRERMRVNPGVSSTRENSRFQQEQQRLEAQRTEIFNSAVQQKVNMTVGATVDSVIGAEVTRYKLNDAQKEHFRESLVNHVVKQMNNDATYKNQVDIRKRAAKGNPDGVASYMATEFNNRIKAAAPEVARTIYGAPKTASAKPANQNQQTQQRTTSVSGGPLMVARRPDNSAIDFGRPDADLLLIQGRAYLKDGRFVQWRR